MNFNEQHALPFSRPPGRSGEVSLAPKTPLVGAAATGFWGHLLPEFMDAMTKNPDVATNPDKDDIKTMMLPAETIADAIVYCVNQPRGITVSDMLIRATNEGMIH